MDLEEFVVEGTMIGKAKATNLQRSADNLKNVVSSDAFGQFVDRNAAEALQRLPGVSLEESQGEGKYIIIRGAYGGHALRAAAISSSISPRFGGCCNARRRACNTALENKARRTSRRESSSVSGHTPIMRANGRPSLVSTTSRSRTSNSRRARVCLRSLIAR